MTALFASTDTGGTFDVVFTDTAGDAIDISGFTIEVTIHATLGASATTVSDGGITTAVGGAGDNVLSVTIPDGHGLPKGTYYIRGRYHEGDSAWKDLFTGEITIAAIGGCSSVRVNCTYSGAISTVIQQALPGLRASSTANITVGYTATAYNAGTISSGTFKPAPANGNLQRYVNGGAHTFAAPDAANDYTIVVQITNNASAGAITFSGFTLQDGDSLTTTDGDDFMLFITKVNGFTHCAVKALQ